MIHFQPHIALIYYPTGLAGTWLDSLQSIHFLLCFVCLHVTFFQIPSFDHKCLFSSLVTWNHVISTLFHCHSCTGSLFIPSSKWQRDWLLIAYVFTQNFRYRWHPSFNLIVEWKSPIKIRDVGSLEISRLIKTNETFSTGCIGNLRFLGWSDFA